MCTRGGRPGRPSSRPRAALHLVLGIDPIISLTDIAGLDRTEALDILEWVAATLVEAVMNDGPRDEQQASAADKPPGPGGRVEGRANHGPREG